MALSGRVGQTATLTAANDDPTGNVDPNAIDNWLEVDGAVDGSGNSTGVAATSGAIGSLSPTQGSTTTASLTAPGQAFVAAQASDPDGNSIWSPPFAIVVTANTDTTAVVVTGTVA